MLSAAHILAMDAKNLFDVVDSIRNRYKHISVTNLSRLEPKESSSPLNCELQSEVGPVSSSSSSSLPISTELINEIGGNVNDISLYDNEHLQHSFNSRHLQTGSNSAHRGIDINQDTTGNEPLKIIEDTLNSSGEHMYCNTSALHSHA